MKRNESEIKMDETQNGSLETLFKLDENIGVAVTLPTKTALHVLSRQRHKSIADIVREAVAYALPVLYPEYPHIYNQQLTEEADKLKG